LARSRRDSRPRAFRARDARGRCNVLPDTLKYENQLIVAEGDYVIAHGRFSGNGRPAAWVAADIVRSTPVLVDPIRPERHQAAAGLQGQNHIRVRDVSRISGPGARSSSVRTC
jgi:hypothetical protein